MERTHYKQEINMTETLMNRINNQSLSEDKENQLYYLFTWSSRCSQWLVEFELWIQSCRVLNILPLKSMRLFLFYICLIKTNREIHVWVLSNFTLLFKWNRRFNGLYLWKKLGVKIGETSAAAFWSAWSRSLGACGYAPMMQLEISTRKSNWRKNWSTNPLQR
jgi:NADH-quinone oxidoreductase subunit E